jgi:phosphoribosylformylglycinamidine synthase
MIFSIEVEISLKNGMLNPEASTIERSLDLLGYEVNNTQTVDIIKFQIEGNSSEEVRNEVDDMCQRLLCNPVIHNYKIIVTAQDIS